MSRVFFIFILLYGALFGFSIEKDYDTAHKKALAEEKILLVFLTKKRCSYCNKELQKLFADEETAALINEYAVFTVVTKGQKASYPIEMLYSDRYPSLFFLDKNELFTCEALRGVIAPKKIEECLHVSDGLHVKRD